MNKKLIVLILFIFLLLSIVVISHLGKKPDPPVQHAANIEFVVDDNTRFDHELEQLIIDINVTELEEEGKLAKEGKYYVIRYQLNYVIYPETSIDKRVHIAPLHPNDSQYISISQDGLVTIKFTDNSFEKQFEIIIKSLDYAASSTAQDKIVINIYRTKQEHIPI